MIAICYTFLLSVLSSNIHFGHTDEGDCLKQPGDILFLVDRSGSVGEDSFQKCLDFVVNVSNYFEIGNDHVKFSIFTTEDNRMGFYFDQYNTKDQLIDLIKKIKNNELMSGYYDCFEKSLVHAQNLVFNKSNGARGFAHKILVAITDGQIYVGTGPKTLQNDDVIMFGIGASINGVNNDTIMRIASSPKHVYIVNNFNFVSHVTQSLINTSCNEMQKNPCESGKCVNATSCIWTGQANYTCICTHGFTGKHCDIDINECDSLPCQNGGTCEDKLNAYTCHCPHLFSGVNCEKDQCSLRPMDIVFLMDGSYSVDTSHFGQQKHFIKQVLQNLTIGPDDVLVGAVTFSTNTDVSFSFKSPFDVTQMKTAIDSVHFMNGVSFLGNAFQTVGNMLQMESRSRSKRIVVLLFDGMMSDPTEAKRMADNLINQFGAKIFVIAFGNDFYHEKAVELTGGVRENVLIHNQPIKFLNRLIASVSMTRI
ncbi:hypothetical protein KUTeg_000442 [Tegillarca granosa]|uniref:Uncharacterized protein n=1 Tax=Tegillarca granosa TaxID=220873 RepID=A0ABQ9G0N3_TEGGR|nr:hypothetical protein KUTeg_000442 [Tegillarca granosa]